MIPRDHPLSFGKILEIIRGKMKKLLIFVAVAVVLAFAFSAIVRSSDNAIDKTGDWIATVGKQDPEKSVILMRRQADRAAHRTAKALEETGRDVKKSMAGTFNK